MANDCHRPAHALQCQQPSTCAARAQGVSRLRTLLATPSKPPHRGSLIYDNPLASERDHAGFILEGRAAITINESTTRLDTVVDESARQAANYVWWCPEDFPPDFDAEWDFWPEAERGLCIMFFA